MSTLELMAVQDCGGLKRLEDLRTKMQNNRMRPGYAGQWHVAGIIVDGVVWSEGPDLGTGWKGAPARSVWVQVSDEDAERLIEQCVDVYQGCVLATKSGYIQPGAYPQAGVLGDFYDLGGNENPKQARRILAGLDRTTTEHTTTEKEQDMKHNGITIKKAIITDEDRAADLAKAEALIAKKKAAKANLATARSAGASDECIADCEAAVKEAEAAALCKKCGRLSVDCDAEPCPMKRSNPKPEQAKPEVDDVVDVNGRIIRHEVQTEQAPSKGKALAQEMREAGIKITPETWAAAKAGTLDWQAAAEQRADRLTKADRKAMNKMLADALKAQGFKATGPDWEAAKAGTLAGFVAPTYA